MGRFVGLLPDPLPPLLLPDLLEGVMGGGVNTGGGVLTGGGVPGNASVG